LKEEGIFWRGGAPGAKDKQGRLADDERFVAAIRGACETAGSHFQRFVSAQGPYGTWLALIERDGQAQRILWNGKDECMVLQTELEQGGWDDTVIIEVTEHSHDGFLLAVREILAPGSSGRKT
jgi:hypothetical protein